MKFLLSLCAFSTMLFAVPIKEVANTVGVRDNQLIGYGLVVGLNGSGDGTSSKFTLQSVSNLLQGMNIKVDPADIKSKNTAAVMVTAKLPAFAKSGDKLDITVSSLGDAKSLQGGTLLLTALRGIDGEIYAIAQGSLST
ncbi:flagellar biosynthesis protein FlgI, partial [Campylobacter upsaliensis]|nr:flagellar biosynthesis protein FlgI [Campylobacter upsaliensis]